jgi:hypothetical protein
MNLISIIQASPAQMLKLYIYRILPRRADNYKGFRAMQYGEATGQYCPEKEEVIGS